MNREAFSNRFPWPFLVEGAEMDATNCRVITVRSGRIELPQSFDHQNLNKEETQKTPGFFTENASESFSEAPAGQSPPLRHRRSVSGKRNADSRRAVILVEVRR